MAEAINYQQIMEELAKPLDLKDIEWRVQSASKNRNGEGFRVLVLPYVTSRAIMNRLDKVVGAYWKDQYQPIGQATAGFRCILSLKIGDEWISREDAAELPGIEPIKGGYSNALKRAGSKWGIGRYLYDLPQFWVDVKDRGEHYVGGNFSIDRKDVYIRGYFNTPTMPQWALPAITQNNGSSSRPNGQSQQMQDQSNTNKQQQSKKYPIQNIDAERQGKALALVTSLLQFLEVPLNLVPQLLEQSSGSTVPYEKASADELGKLYHHLKPSQVYVQSCSELGVDVSRMLYYANIVLAPHLKQPLEHVYALAFFMTKDLAEQALVLVREDQTASVQPQVG